MLTLVRRFVVVAALVFWLGGFTFYGAVVIPVGLHQIGKEQTRVTGPVTYYLNLACTAALVPFLWDVLACRDRSAGRSTVRWVAWAGTAATLAVLFGLHQLLMRQVYMGAAPTDPTFPALHEAYLGVGTAQWLCGVVYAAASLAAWRAEDREQPLAIAGRGPEKG